MLSRTILNANQILQLQLGLSSFGLQPVDWIIHRHSDLTFKIQNKSEDTFYFIGKIPTVYSSKWAKIQLASL